jgi:hypothetical protein
MKPEKEFVDRAKKENLAIFSVMIDRRHVPFSVDKWSGYKHESAGCMSLDKAARIMAILREDD